MKLFKFKRHLHIKIVFSRSTRCHGNISVLLAVRSSRLRKNALLFDFKDIYSCTINGYGIQTIEFANDTNSTDDHKTALRSNIWKSLITLNRILSNGSKDVLSLEQHVCVL